MPPVSPGIASVGMSPAEFETWAISVEDYGLICGWTPPLAASYMGLLCTREVQQRIDARVNKQIFRNATVSIAIGVIRSFVVGPRCEVASWMNFFRHTQAQSDSVSAYVSRCRALASECSFKCPECRQPLDDYMLSRKIVMGLHTWSMKAEVLCEFPRLNSVNDIVNQCEIMEARKRWRTGNRQM